MPYNFNPVLVAKTKELLAQRLAQRELLIQQTSWRPVKTRHNNLKKENEKEYMDYFLTLEYLLNCLVGCPVKYASDRLKQVIDTLYWVRMLELSNPEWFEKDGE